MNPPPQFYTAFAESSKFIFYIILGVMLIYAIVQKRAGKKDWANWVHWAIMINFIIGFAYSGIRMLTTDEVNDMIVRRIFAGEAWFNAGCASFYFLIWWIWEERKQFYTPNE